MSTGLICTVCTDIYMFLSAKSPLHFVLCLMSPSNDVLWSNCLHTVQFEQKANARDTDYMNCRERTQYRTAKHSHHRQSTVSTLCTPNIHTTNT